MRFSFGGSFIHENCSTGYVLSVEGEPLSNDPCKVDSNFLCYAATGLYPHRNVIIFTQRMHKPTGRQLTQ